MNARILILGSCLLAAACGKTDTVNTTANTVTAMENDVTNVAAIPEDNDATALANDESGDGGATASADAWIGRWTGPEGLFLDIAPGTTSGNYALTLKDNLDTQADYTAKAVDGGIAFTRNGKPVTIHAGTGKDTGFKYLVDKTDCLILVPGKEGYCR